MPAGDADIGRFQPATGHLLGHPDRLFYRFLGLININYQAFMKPVRRGNAHAQDTQPFFFIDVLSSHYGKPEPQKNCIFLESPKDLDAIRSAIEHAIERNKCTVLLFDTLSNLLVYQENFPILKFAHSLTLEKGQDVIKLFLIMKDNPVLEKESKELISDLSMLADKTVDLG